jgi:hypothetical protein
VCVCITLPQFIYSTDSAGNGIVLCTLMSISTLGTMVGR